MSDEIVEAGWKLNEDDEACYIDAIEAPYDPNRVYSDWHELPDLLLEQIFKHLTIKERYYASLVCYNWYRAFYLPGVWSNVIIDDRTLTRQKFNYYSGWQAVLDHLKAQMCLTRIGRFIKGLTFVPDYSFSNLFQFISLLTWCLEENKRNRNISSEMIGIGSRIKYLSYVFPCNMAQTEDPEGIKLFGTGGQMLKSLKEFMACINQLRTLKLIDLMLERYEAKHLLDEVLESSCMSLKVLHLVNVTMTHCPIMHVGLFLNLQVLVISPQSLDDDVLQLIADGNLRHLHLFQNSYSPPGGSVTTCSAKAWYSLKHSNPKMRVHLEIDSNAYDADICLQLDAPVYSILYKTPNTKITSAKIIRMIDAYKSTLRLYGLMEVKCCAAAEGDKKRVSSDVPTVQEFDDRIDCLMVLMCRTCPYLTTLVVNEQISTSTALLIAYTAKNLQRLYVRRSFVSTRCDWPKNPDWDDEFYMWLMTASKSIVQTEKEISQILEYNFKFLTDEAYKLLNINARHIK